LRTDPHLPALSPDENLKALSPDEKLARVTGAPRDAAIGAEPVSRAPAGPRPRGGAVVRAAKRAIDVSASAVALLVLSPVLLVVAAAVRLNMGSPVLFRQERPGLGTRPFTMLKFRTMRAPGPDDDPMRSDSRRLTPVGAFLRRTSLDELPELLNVLRGDMSLVGPRPLLNEYLPYFREREMQRFHVRPGITGWAQVNGRNEASWDERLGRDAWYVENWSLGLDLRILARTVLAVAGGSGVVADPRSVMLNLDEERAAERAAPPEPHAGA
jgi:lipopolysaccharide/colanic/teichoic acid biosynthesis glycosyltransferase